MPSGVLGTRPADRVTPSSQIATTQKSPCTSQADRATDPSGHCHPTPPQLVMIGAGEPAGDDTDRYEVKAQSRQVAGAAERKARAQSPSIKTAYPSAFSQVRPLSRISPTYELTRTNPQTCSFMPREAPASGRHACWVRRWRASPRQRSRRSQVAGSSVKAGDRSVAETVRCWPQPGRLRRTRCRLA